MKARPSILLLWLLPLLGLGTSLATAADGNGAPSVRIQRMPSGFQIRWLTQPNHRYRVEAAASLKSGWTHAAEFQATTPETSWTDAPVIPPLPQRFYRVLDLGPEPVVGVSVIDVRFQIVLADRVIDVEQWTVQAP